MTIYSLLFVSFREHILIAFGHAQSRLPQLPLSTDTTFPHRHYLFLAMENCACSIRCKSYREMKIVSVNKLIIKINWAPCMCSRFSVDVIYAAHSFYLSIWKGNLFDKRGKTSLEWEERLPCTKKNARPAYLWSCERACYRSRQSDGGWPYLTSQLRERCLCKQQLPRFHFYHEVASN